MRDGGSLPPWLLQVCGIVLLAAFVIHWWSTGQQSELLVGAALTLATWGTTAAGLRRLKRTLYKGEPHERDASQADEED